LLGLLLFAHDVNEAPEGDAKNARPADGIVVLTGGTERLPAGLALLNAHAAPRMLVSGVDPRAKTERLFGKIPHKLKSCCITLGTHAEDTSGNAREAAAWAQQYDMKSLYVVTANYHMRRALLEFSLVLPPETALLPFSVSPSSVRTEDWSDYPGTASL